MIDCDQARALLPVAMDKALAEEHQGDLAMHLQNCGPCATLERTLQATIQLSAWPGQEIPLPPTLGQAVVEAVRAAKLAANPPAEDAGDDPPSGPAAENGSV